MPSEDSINRRRPNPTPSRGSSNNPSNPNPSGSEATDSSPPGPEQRGNIDETLSFEKFGRGNVSGSVIGYPSELKSAAGSTDYVRFIFKQYAPPFRSSQSRGTQGGYNNSIVGLKNDDELATVVLYMPEDVQAQYGAQWGGKSIQNTTGAILQSLGNISEGDIGGAFISAANSIPTAAEGAFVSAVNKVLDALQKTGQGEGLGTNDIFSSTAGVVLNPNTELLFQGFDLRTFNLTFKMVAKDDKEAKEIRDIITTFKKAMLPKINTGSSSGSQGTRRGAAPENTENTNAGDVQNFIGVPSLVEVSFMQGASENQFVTQFKPCAITSLNINYTPDGSYTTYRDGPPVSVVMQIGFAETKLVYREDIYPGLSY